MKLTHYTSIFVQKKVALVMSMTVHIVAMEQQQFDPAYYDVNPIALPYTIQRLYQDDQCDLRNVPMDLLKPKLEQNLARTFDDFVVRTRIAVAVSGLLYMGISMVDSEKSIPWYVQGGMYGASVMQLCTPSFFEFSLFRRAADQFEALRKRKLDQTHYGSS